MVQIVKFKGSPDRTKCSNISPRIGILIHFIVQSTKPSDKD